MQGNSINDQIFRLQELLKLEKKEDFERYRQEVLELSLSEKRKRGRSSGPATSRFNTEPVTGFEILRRSPIPTAVGSPQSAEVLVDPCYSVVSAVMTVSMLTT